MTDPAFEALIKYRRELRHKHETEVRFRWGITQVAVTYPARKVWHLTTAVDLPARSVCGYALVELGPRGMRQPWNACKSCREKSPDFVDLWQQS